MLDPSLDTIDWRILARLQDEARDARGQLFESLRALSAERIVHGDLSAYNMLWWEGRLVIIDFPQAVDPLPLDTHLLDFFMQALWNETQYNPLGARYWSCVPYLLGEGQVVTVDRIKECAAVFGGEQETHTACLC